MIYMNCCCSPSFPLSPLSFVSFSFLSFSFSFVFLDLPLVTSSCEERASRTQPCCVEIMSCEKEGKTRECSFTLKPFPFPGGYPNEPPGEPILTHSDTSSWSLLFSFLFLSLSFSLLSPGGGGCLGICVENTKEVKVAAEAPEEERRKKRREERERERERREKREREEVSLRWVFFQVTAAQSRERERERDCV